MSKIFLADIDGVVFKFIKTFEKWISTQENYTPISNHTATTEGYLYVDEWLDISVEEAEEVMTKFFETDFSQHFVTYRDAIEVIEKLKNRGWNFVAITAIGNSELSKQNRQLALDHHFGKYTFSDVLVVDPYGSKEEILKTFKPTLWVDDTPDHVTSGDAAGHVSFRMKRGDDIRATRYGTNVIEVEDWYGILKWLEENEG